MAPIGSVVSFAETPATILNKIQDAMALLRTTYTLPISPFHQLNISASQLTALLLSCVSDFSQISNTQAAMLYTDVNDLLTSYQLETEIRPMLETFGFSLSLSMGDDVKAAREAQMIQSMQLSMGKTDVQGSDSDIITFGLTFHEWIYQRGHDYGVGSTNDAVSTLIAILRWTAWTPRVFYTQLLTTAFMCLAQNPTTSSIWRIFIIGRLPSLLASFEAASKGVHTSQSDWRSAMLSALEYIYRRPDLIVECEHILSRATSSPEDDLGRSFNRDLLHSLIQRDLLDLNFALQLDPAFNAESGSRLFVEAQEAGADFALYLESRLALDIEITDVCNWIARLWRDSSTHHTFANVVLKRFTQFATSLDTDDLSHLCRILYTSDYALDILALHIKLTELVFRALRFLEEYDCGTVGDPQTAVSHLGDVVLLVQYTVIRFRLSTSHIPFMDQSISASYLFSSTTVQDPGILSSDEANSFTAWFKALFDSNSEGIEDNIIRSTPLKLLLRLSTSLITQALRSKLDPDILSNGLSYFTSPLLNWTLFNVLRGVLKESESSKSLNPAFLDILQTFVLSPSCPRPVLLLCKDQLYSLTTLKRTKSIATFNATAIRDKLTEVTGRNCLDTNRVVPVNLHSWEEQPKQDIHDAITAASGQKVPSLNIEKCLRISPPTKFLKTLWSEIVISGSMREIEIVKRMAMFVLATPRSSSQTPPLLPIFLHVVLPSLISNIDSQQPVEQNVTADILATIISSALTAAAHLDWAVRTICSEHRPILGQHSPAMVRQLAAELRTQKDKPAGKLVAQKLAASQGFVTNFPFFVKELNA
ncbi:hypothetical protein Ac2012v2_000621 [Leucoagaricus gongylophorus]